MPQIRYFDLCLNLAVFKPLEPVQAYDPCTFYSNQLDTPMTDFELVKQNFVVIDPDLQEKGKPGPIRLCSAWTVAHRSRLV